MTVVRRFEPAELVLGFLILLAPVMYLASGILSTWMVPGPLHADSSTGLGVWKYPGSRIDAVATTGSWYRLSTGDSPGTVQRYYVRLIQEPSGRGRPALGPRPCIRVYPGADPARTFISVWWRASGKVGGPIFVAADTQLSGGSVPAVWRE